VKKRVFAELDRVMARDTILATNTSTLSVMELATPSRTRRVCGMHFFNPASTMTWSRSSVPDRLERDDRGVTTSRWPAARNQWR